jgi:hypothetical protein
MFDRGDSNLECLIEETAALNIKHSRLLSPLSNIQGCCLLYQTFKAAVSSIKHSRLLSPLSTFKAAVTSQAFKAAVSSIKHLRQMSPL